jgi:hypothetical protein
MSPRHTTPLGGKIRVWQAENEVKPALFNRWQLNISEVMCTEVHTALLQLHFLIISES